MAKARQSARGLPGARRSCQLATPRRCHRGSTGRALAGRGGRAARSAPARVCLGSANSMAEARACHTRAKKERAHRSRAVLERARTRGRAQRWLRAHSPAPSPRSSARPLRRAHRTSRLTDSSHPCRARVRGVARPHAAALSSPLSRTTGMHAVPLRARRHGAARRPGPPWGARAPFGRRTGTPASDEPGGCAGRRKGRGMSRHRGGGAEGGTRAGPRGATGARRARARARADARSRQNRAPV